VHTPLKRCIDTIARFQTSAIRCLKSRVAPKVIIVDCEKTVLDVAIALAEDYVPGSG
jgi:hypothetical protein